jgi:hypothetical protein
VWGTQNLTQYRSNIWFLRGGYQLRLLRRAA